MRPIDQDVDQSADTAMNEKQTSSLRIDTENMTLIAAPGAGYTTFREIFLPADGRRVRVTVPDYQRAYDWRTEQRQDLFQDLERLAELATGDALETRGGHFCGTVICTPAQVAKGYESYDVVDGQQRLTTLVLLHSKLSQAINVDPAIVSGPRSLFLPQSADADYFRSFARDSGHCEPSSVGQEQYKKAATEIQEWIQGLGELATPAKMLELIETRLQFIFFVLPNSNEVSKVFETINNRGKPLTQMDLVKNHLIYMRALHGWDGDVNATWSKIQHLAVGIRFRGGESVDTVLRAVVTAMLKYGKRKAGDTDHKVIKRHINAADHGDRFDCFLKFLESAFRTFHELRGAFETGKNEDVRTQLTYLNQHPSISGVLPLILARQFCRQDEQGADVLAAIEKANFRLYGLFNASKKSNSHHVPLHRLAYDYFQKHSTGEQVCRDERKALSRSLIEALTATVTNQHEDGFGQIVKALTLDDDDSADFFDWKGLRYFLARWEESMMKNQSFEYRRLGSDFHQSHSNDYLAREHIYPASSSGPLANYRRKLLLRRLGNFMLLPQGVNSSLSNDLPEMKAQKLAEHGLQNSLLLQNKQLQGFVDHAQAFQTLLEARSNDAFGSVRKNRFNSQTIGPNQIVAEAKTLCDLREEQMIRFALSAWRMPGESLGEREGEQFLGMFSFRFEDETYQSDKERAATKETANYVVELSPDADSGNMRLVSLQKRLHARNKALEWKDESQELRNAA